MGQRYEVRLANTGEVFHCAEDENLLRGMEMLGRRGIPVGCRGGGCGVCRIQVLAGVYATRRMSRACVSAEDEAAGILLACKVYPQSDLSVEAIGPMRRCVTCALPGAPGATG